METPLQHLLDQERALSRKRRQLHLRIEYLRGTGAGEPGTQAMLAELVIEEQEVSASRRELHAIIDKRRRDGGSGS
jgi:hypothetical protein